MQARPHTYIINEPANTDNKDQRKMILIYLFSIVGFVNLVIFGLVNSYNHNYLPGLIELLAALTTLFNALAFRAVGKFNIASSTILLSLGVTLVCLLLYGGINGTGLLWFFTFPVVAFFLKGAKKGLYAIILLAGLASIIIILGEFAIIPALYSIRFVQQFAVAFISVCALIYFFAFTNEKNLALLDEKTVRLALMNDSLEYEISKRKITERTLYKNNADLENIKKATLNVLDDLNQEKEKIDAERAKDEALIASVGDGLVAVDSHGFVTIMNAPAKNMLGISTAVIGRPYEQLWSAVNDKGENVPIDERPISTSIRTKNKISTSSLFLARSDGTRFPVAITVSPILLDNQVVGAIQIFRDISVEKQTDKAKTEFVSLASHQLRTPLTAINWYSEILTSGDTGSLNPQQQELVDGVRESSERMSLLVNSLLNVSRVDLGTFAIEPRLLDVNEVAKSTLKEFTPAITKHRLHVSEVFDTSPPQYNADPQLLRIIYQNLLSNAIKYTPSGGHINFTVHFDTLWLMIIVKDTGYGIPKKQQPQVFNKLFRADNVQRMQIEGTGLGLYLVKSIIEQAGGQIWFESEVDQGTTFFVQLPLDGMKAKQGTKGLST